MRIFLYITMLVLLGFGGSQVMPWWIVVVLAGLLAMLIKLKPTTSFLAGFLGVALLWGGYATYLDVLNEGVLSSRIGEMFGGLNSVLLILATAIFGGLLGGLGGLSGHFARKLIE